MTAHPQFRRALTIAKLPGTRARATVVRSAATFGSSGSLRLGQRCHPERQRGIFCMSLVAERATGLFEQIPLCRSG